MSFPTGLCAIEPAKEPVFVPEVSGEEAIGGLKRSLESMKPFDKELGKKEAAIPIVVNGDKVQYDYTQKTVSGAGNVSITYKEVKLTCDNIVVNIEEKEAVAEGNVTLYQEGSIFTCDKIVYNFAVQKGELINGAMKMPPWYGNARLIQKTDDKLYKLNQSYVTTCDLEHPHYRIEAKTIKVYLGEKVTVWNAFFFFGNVPVMYMPYYNHPLKDNLPQMDIVPGYDKDWGAYTLTAWRYFFHPDSKGHVHLDYRSKRGFGEGADYSYKMDKFGTGYARFYYAHDREPPDADKKDRWRAQWRHRWEVDQNSIMTAEYHKLSDKDFLKDFFYKEEYEVDKQPCTYLSYIGAKDDYSFEILAEKRVNRFFTVTEKLPEAKMYIRKMKILDFMNLYYRDESSVARLRMDIADDVQGAVSNDDYHATRIDSYNELSYPIRLLGFLNLNPFAGIRETYYSQNSLGETNIVRNIFNCGAELYARFYKIYDIETDWFGLNIHDIRHLVMPSVKYEYIKTPNYGPSDLYRFDSIDAFRGENGIVLTLETKLQTKRSEAGGSRKTVDLVTFIADTKYMIRDDEGNENELIDIDLDLEIRPYDWMFLKADATIDESEHRFTAANADFYLNKGEDLDFGLGYRYEWDTLGAKDISQITSQFSYRINKDWKFRIYERYGIQDKKFQQQEYTIYKDLHCWIGEFTCRIKDTCRIKNGLDYSFWVVFRLKAFPDMPFLFRTTYKGPAPGETMQH